MENRGKFMGGSLNNMGGQESRPGVLIYGSKTDDPGMGWGASMWGLARCDEVGWQGRARRQRHGPPTRQGHRSTYRYMWTYLVTMIALAGAGKAAGWEGLPGGRPGGPPGRAAGPEVDPSKMIVTPPAPSSCSLVSPKILAI